MVCLQVVTSMLLYKDYYWCPLLGFGQNLGLGLWSQARVKMRPHARHFEAGSLGDPLMCYVAGHMPINGILHSYL